MSEKYSIYSVFDVEQHKKTYVNYLEVIIGESGKVAYAIPSHQEALIKIACRKLGVTREELNAMCPKEYYLDFMTWLCKITGCCSVWNEFVMGYEFSDEQVKALEKLKAHGVYKGEIPKVKENLIMDRKMFVYKDNWGDENSVALVFNMYNDNNNLFVGLEEYDKEYDYWDSFCDLTVNVGKLPFLESAINIELSGKEKIDFLIQNGFGALTDKKLRSGFVEFPVFKFNAEKVKEIDPMFFQKYAKEHGMNVDERDVVQAFKDLAKKYDFSVFQDGSCFKLCAKDTDNKWTRWIGFYPEKDTVAFFGNTDHLNIWLCETRKDFTPEKCLQFVNDLNDLFELTDEDKFAVSELIDPEDWQEIANVRDAYDDPRYFVKPEVSLKEQISKAENTARKNNDVKKDDIDFQR